MRAAQPGDRLRGAARAGQRQGRRRLGRLRAAATAATLEQAAEDAAAADRLNPFSIEPLLTGAAIAEARGQYERAGELLSKAADRQPDNPEPWLALARLGLLVDNRPAAFRAAVAALDVDRFNQVGQFLYVFSRRGRAPLGGRHGHAAAGEAAGAPKPKPAKPDKPGAADHRAAAARHPAAHPHPAAHAHTGAPAQRPQPPPERFRSEELLRRRAAGSLVRMATPPSPLSPTLSPGQLETLAAVGEERTAAEGEFLFRIGDARYPFIVVLEGEAAVLDGAGNEIARQGPGGFLAEMNLLTGQTVYVDGVVTEPMRYIAVDRDDLRPLLFEDAALADILLNTFIRRREILQQREGVGFEVIGPRSSASTRHLLDYARRGRLPHIWRDTEHDDEWTRTIVAELDPDELPLVRLPGGTELRNPSNGQLWRALGIGLELDPARRSTWR